MPRKKGEPTKLNLWTLFQLFGFNDTTNNFQADAAAIRPHIRRCAKAGLVQVDPDKPENIKLTPAGVQALKPFRDKADANLQRMAFAEEWR